MPIKVESASDNLTLQQMFGQAQMPVQPIAYAAPITAGLMGECQPELLTPPLEQIDLRSYPIRWPVLFARRKSSMVAT